MNEAQKKVVAQAWGRECSTGESTIASCREAACDAVLAMPAEGELTEEQLDRAVVAWPPLVEGLADVRSRRNEVARAIAPFLQYARPLPVGQPSEEQIQDAQREWWKVMGGKSVPPDTLVSDLERKVILAISQRTQVQPAECPACANARRYPHVLDLAGTGTHQAETKEHPAEPSEPMVPRRLLEEEYRRGVMDGTVLPSHKENESGWTGVIELLLKRRTRLLTPPPQDRVQVTQDRSHNWVVTLDGVQQGGIHGTDRQAGLMAEGLRIGLKAQVR